MFFGLADEMKGQIIWYHPTPCKFDKTEYMLGFTVRLVVGYISAPQAIKNGDLGPCVVEQVQLN